MKRNDNNKESIYSRNGLSRFNNDLYDDDITIVKNDQNTASSNNLHQSVKLTNNALQQSIHANNPKITFRNKSLKYANKTMSMLGNPTYFNYFLYDKRQQMFIANDPQPYSVINLSVNLNGYYKRRNAQNEKSLIGINKKLLKNYNSISRSQSIKSYNMSNNNIHNRSTIIRKSKVDYNNLCSSMTIINNNQSQRLNANNNGNFLRDYRNNRYDFSFLKDNHNKRVVLNKTLNNVIKNKMIKAKTKEKNSSHDISFSPFQLTNTKLLSSLKHNCIYFHLGLRKKTISTLMIH